jgi:hypothetical protein
LKEFRVNPAGSDGLASKDADVKSWDVIDSYFVHFSVSSPDEANSLVAGLKLAADAFEHKIKETKRKKYVLGELSMYTSSNIAEHMANNMGAWRTAPEQLQADEALEPPSNENTDTNTLESINPAQTSSLNTSTKGNKL